MQNTKQFITRSFVITSLVFTLIFVVNQEISAASAVAFDGARAVYGYSYNQPNVGAARNAALISCSKRGGASCRVITSCSVGGYGIIYLRRLPGRRIEAIGASCGAQSWQQANTTAQRSCNSQNRGACAGPKSSWYDQAGSTTSTNRSFNRGQRPTRPTTPAQPIRWDTTLVNTLMFRNATTPGQRFTLSCPPRGYLMNVYGTGMYHITSSVCTAAVHRGVITTNGGVVRLQIYRGPAVFKGSARNGVRSYTSQPQPQWRLGFVFI